MTAPDHTPDAVQKTLAHTGASIHELKAHRAVDIASEARCFKDDVRKNISNTGFSIKRSSPALEGHNL